MRVKALLAGLLLCHTVSALQQPQVLPDVMSTVSVSNHSLNVLRLKQDRIESFAVPDDVEVQHDAKTGEVVFKIEGEKPVEGFVVGEAGKRYPLRFVPSDIPAETIVLISEKEEVAHERIAQPYTELLAQLLKAMFNQKDIEGFRVEAVNTKQPFKKGQLIHRDNYLGIGIIGEVYEFKNPSQTPLQLNEMDFYREGVRAIAMTTKTLPVKGFTRIFVMRDSHNDK